MSLTSQSLGKLDKAREVQLSIIAAWKIKSISDVNCDGPDRSRHVPLLLKL